MNKKIVAILRKLFLLNWPYAYVIGYAGVMNSGLEKDN